ncbi:hypothetical protein CHS0354_015141 [Potamilus streckersoni]|uniref:G-protein coupled receptors family 1 profile domain-containing protein n=1 Tax=Potamilus streckersoni TaxID=2493646 RepID=A0AAE0SCZ2_9BIVA|nr:hypothetical protein CHS0354_015141 [Potamilus streckersoni]
MTSSLLIGSYVYAFIWAIIPVTGWGGYSVEPYGTSCTLQWDNNQSYITIVALFCILLPSVIMIGCYGTILVHSRQRRNRMKKWTCNVSMDTKIAAQENYLIKITFTMCWGFLITWMPYAVVSMWTAYGRVSILPIRLVVPSVLLAKTSTVINPTIYFMLNKRFRPFLVESLNVFNRADPVRRSMNSNSNVDVYISEKKRKCNDSDKTICKNSDGTKNLLSTPFENNTSSSPDTEAKVVEFDSMLCELPRSSL